MISPYFHSVSSGSKYYNEALAKGYLVTDANGSIVKAYDNAALYDVFNPAARQFAFAAVEAG